eukprot:7380433-Prymnesium_polylepis.1
MNEDIHRAEVSVLTCDDERRPPILHHAVLVSARGDLSLSCRLGSAFADSSCLTIPSCPPRAATCSGVRPPPLRTLTASRTLAGSSRASSTISRITMSPDSLANITDEADCVHVVRVRRVHERSAARVLVQVRPLALVAKVDHYWLHRPSAVGARPAGAILRINVSADSDQQLHALQEAIPRGDHQRAPPVVVLQIDEVDQAERTILRPPLRVIEEHLDALIVPVLRCARQGAALSPFLALCDIRPRFEQLGDDLKVPLFRSNGERGRAVGLSACIDVCTIIEQEANRGLPALARLATSGEVQRGDCAAGIRLVDRRMLGAFLPYDLRQLDIVAAGRGEQQRVLIHLALVHRIEIRGGSAKRTKVFVRLGWVEDPTHRDVLVRKGKTDRRLALGVARGRAQTSLHQQTTHCHVAAPCGA